MNSNMIYRVFNSLCAYVYFYLRPLVKWILRQTTCLCELQRICYGAEVGAQRAHKFEYSLRRSRNKVLRALVEKMDTFCETGRLHGENGNRIVEYSACAIIRAKKIKAKIHKEFQHRLTVCLAQTFGYRQLIHEVEQIRTLKYSSDDLQHEEKLLKLWNLLMPHEPLQSRITKQWGTIGFQGDDPKTDFRGMGILGLENLLFFSTNYVGTARHVLSHSHHPEYGYSFAIVGINLTSMAHEFLLKGDLKTHMFNAVQGRPSVNHFHQIYVYLFYEFDKFWLSKKPKNIMEFSRIRDLFHTRIGNILSRPHGLLRLNFAIETI